MGYVRIEDSAMSHPKIARLTATAFRLWIWGLCYTQMQLTDGYVPTAVLPARSAAGAGELLKTHLWERAEDGYQIHDYLKYNDSKAEVESRRHKARARIAERRAFEEPRALDVRANISQRSQKLPETQSQKHGFVSVCSSSERKEGSGEKTEAALGDRAARLLEDLYPAWYSKFRHGAKLRLVHNQLMLDAAMSIVALWDDDRIEKLAQIFLTTDEDWISKTDRGFKLFVTRASWCDDRLRQAEKAHGAA